MESNLIVRIPEELKSKLQEVAKSKGISLSGYVRMILLEITNGMEKDISK